jgi:hypothetical protein
VAIVLRAVAGLFAFYAAFLWWRKKDTALPAIRKKVSTALLLEAGFFLVLIPSIIAAFAYNLTSEYLFYFDHTPEQILLYGTAIPCLAIVLVVPPLLLKLRATIKHEAPTQEIVKWSGSNWRCLPVCGVLVQLFDALGMLHGTLPAGTPTIRFRLPASTRKLPKFCRNSFWFTCISHNRNSGGSSSY